MDRDEVRAWMKRWEIVNQHTIEEVRALTPEEKFEQLVSLMDSADLFEWPDTSDEDQRVRELWMRLHELQ